MSCGVQSACLNLAWVVRVYGNLACKHNSVVRRVDHVYMLDSRTVEMQNKPLTK